MKLITPSLVGSTVNCPFGLFMSEAILANSLLGAIPPLAVSPVVSKILARSSSTTRSAHLHFDDKHFLPIKYTLFIPERKMEHGTGITRCTLSLYQQHSAYKASKPHSDSASS